MAEFKIGEPDDFPRVMRELLDLTGTTQSGLAKQLGVSRVAVWNGLQASTNPELRRMLRWLNALGCELVVRTVDEEKVLDEETTLDDTGE